MKRVVPGLLLLAITLPVLAFGGAYQRTADHGAIIWNNIPAPGDGASWDGGTDADGYASGFGTLTWSKYGEWVSKYTGTAAHGRLNGYINNVDADGDAFAGPIVHGIKQPGWHKLPGSRLARTRYADQRESGSSSPPQQTLAERQQEARAWLVTFMATRFIAHRSEPSDFSEVLVRELFKWGSDVGIDNSLATIFPDATDSERAAIHGFLTAITEGKFSSGEVGVEITKEVAMVELQKRDPALATDVTIAGGAWELISEGIKASGRSANR